MLEPDYFAYKTDNLLRMYEGLEDWIIKDISMRVIKAGEMSGTMDWDLYKLSQMGMHREAIEKRVAELTGLSQKEVRKLLQDAVLTSYDADKGIFEEMGIEIPKPMQSAAIRAVMNAELIRTNNEFRNLTRTTMIQTSRDLMRLMDEAQLRVDIGVQSYSGAICEVLDKYAKKGVMIEFPSGNHRTLEAAVQNAMLTAMNQTAAQVTNQYISENEVDYVLVSAHYGARHDKRHPNSLESHDWWQGKIFKINGSEKGYPNLLECTGYTIDANGIGKVLNMKGLHGYGCRHSHSPAYPGMHNPYEDEHFAIDRKKSQEVYENQQKQRAMERGIRAEKRAFMEKQQQIDIVTDDALKADLELQRDQIAYKLRQKNATYNKFCEDHDLQKQMFRTKTVGFDKSMAAKARGRASAYKNSRSEKIRIPQIPASSITRKIESGEYSLRLSHQQYEKHVLGTKKFEEYAASRKNPQSKLYISYDDAQVLIETKSGSGIIKVDGNGNARPQEQIVCDEVIGAYYGNGEYHDTKKAVIHYSKKGSHIVPVKGGNYD